MANDTIQLTDQLYDYLIAVSLREPDVLRRLRAETATLDRASMQMSPDTGQFLAFLIKLIGTKRAIEVGVFTGYSSLAIALALPDDGQLIACDVSDEWTAMGRRFWQEAGVNHKIDLRLAPAVQTLQQLIDEGHQNSFDFIFIDADKPNYATYYEQAYRLLRPGGLICIDNVLWHGRVLDESRQDEGTQAIRVLNKNLYTDERVDLSLVPIGDGVTMLRKR
jgi:caffeoyl-CoA O-methyltransferase